jgi:ribosomal protein S18 acetylase RimI-like enzyme
MPDSTRAIALVAAATRTDEELAALFGAVYADYFVPVHLDAIALRTMARRFDLDLAASRVVFEGGQPAGIAMLGLRGETAWVGGMGVVPGARRAGLGRRLMESVIGEARARGCRSVQLEVLEQNAGAIALYRGLGFHAWRTLDVWALGTPLPGAGAREIPAPEARAWIAQRRAAPEPWQRADGSLDHFDLPETPLRGLEVRAGGARTGAAVALVAGGRASLLQMALEGDEPVAAARALIAGAFGWAPGVRFLNVPTGHPAAAALAAAGATLEARQFEMTLALVPGPAGGAASS